MKNVYIDFKDGYNHFSKDYEQGNEIYSKEYNRLAISDVKEVISDGDFIRVHYRDIKSKNLESVVILYANTIKKMVIN